MTKKRVNPAHQEGLFIAANLCRCAARVVQWDAKASVMASAMIYSGNPTQTYEVWPVCRGCYGTGLVAFPIHNLCKPWNTNDTQRT